MADSSLSRIAVVGVTGSGKTTLGEALAQRLSIPHIELDALHWLPGWQEAPLDLFRERVAEALSGDCWVVDGNYSKVRDLIWTRADTLIWLDFSLGVSLWRLLKRTLRRRIDNENLWNSGNRESLVTHFFTRDSLFVWAIRSRRVHRATYPQALADPAYAHLKVVRLKSPRAADRWLSEVPFRP